MKRPFDSASDGETSNRVSSRSIDRDERSTRRHVQSRYPDSDPGDQPASRSPLEAHPMDRPTAHQLALQLFEATRHKSDLRGVQPILAELAVDAATWLADRDGRELPALIQRYAADFRVPAEAQRTQREWLKTLQTADEISDYLPSVAYTLGDRGRAFESLSSRSIRAITNIAGISRLQPGSGDLSIMDLAAGSGSLLLDAGRAATALGYRPVLRGADINVNTAVVASATLFMAGYACDIEAGDSLFIDPFSGIPANLSISQPPFGVYWRGQADNVRSRHHDGWYRFGLPSETDASWLFVSRLVEKLADPAHGGGRTVAFVAQSALSSTTASVIRQNVLDSDLLESIIALPAGVTQASVPVYALALTNVKAAHRRGKVQVVDLRTASKRSGFHEAPQEIRTESLETLLETLNAGSNSPTSRILLSDVFVRERHSVRVMPTGTKGPSWRVELTRGDDRAIQLAKRYGPIEIELAAEARIEVNCDLEVARFFDSAAAATTRWLQHTQWPSTRLSALLVDAPAVTGRDTVDESDVNVVTMPATPHQEAVPGLHQPAQGDRTRYLVLRVNTDHVLPDYLVGWLNSPHGHEARTRAYTAASSGHVINAVRSDHQSLMRLCDELVVPVPQISVQQEFATADARLSATSKLIDSVRRDVWDNPSKVGEVKRRFGPLFDQSLTTWVAELPFPVASALWTLETRRGNSHAAHEQILLVWEAYAAFTAVMQLSALVQDPFLTDEELPQIRAILAKSGLSFERATLGVWSLIGQRLSSVFRNMLKSDSSEKREQVLELFGGASSAALERLLSTEVTTLVADANAKRNLWRGHAGTLSDAEQREHIEYLSNTLETLRELTGGVWADLHLLRAGDGYKKSGHLRQRAELAMGVNAPFRTVEVTVGEMMETGALYLCTDGATRPLQLLPLLMLRSSPSTAQDICYFYSKRESRGVRMVSYHLGGSSEITEPLAEVAATVELVVGTA